MRPFRKCTSYPPRCLLAPACITSIEPLSSCNNMDCRSAPYANHGVRETLCGALRAEAESDEWEQWRDRSKTVQVLARQQNLKKVT